MSGRGGTRGKKISVLHMLGTWEGYIDGCNCPGCKEVEAEEKVSLSIINKSKNTPTKKVKKIVKKPKEIERAEIEISEDPATGETIAETVSANYKTITVASASPETSETLKENKTVEKVVIAGSSFEIKSKSDNCEIKSISKAPSEDESNREPVNIISISKPIEDGNRVETSGNNVKIILGSNVSSLSDEENEIEFHDDDEETNNEVLSISSEKKTVSSDLHRSGIRQKQSHNKSARGTEEMPIKQEPLEYFSDEEEIDIVYGKRPSELGRVDPRGTKRARMVTSEVENIYAKPRMVFTGKGVVKKIEPGMDKTPKSKRGRKPGKIVVPIKIKQEPKDLNDEENELDRLQEALSEAAENISGEEDDEFLYEQFEEGQKESIHRISKKKSGKVFKRVDCDGDKYVECNMCFKMLKESSIKQHYKTHTGEKPYHCDECNSRFTRKGDVDRHRKLVHKNLKPFKCQKCGKEFSDRKNLKVHLQNHDKAIYYTCDTCDFKFGKREYYENHIRYIHPLPNGSIPVFTELDEDLAGKQLRELEKEERRERLAKNGESNENDLDEELDEEEENAMEITLTEGKENKIISSEKIASLESDTDLNNDSDNLLSSGCIGGDMPLLEVTSEKEMTERLFNMEQETESTAVSISNGTLSFVQTVVDTEAQDEELVNKAIAAAVSQAASTIETLQNLGGPNMASNGLMDEYADEDEDDMLDEEDDIQEMLDAEEDMIPVSGGGNLVAATKPMEEDQQQQQQPTEIHINASVGGQMRKFIIQVPAGSALNIQSPEGMEMIVSMVNQLCAGKGDLDGPIEVVMHNSNAATQNQVPR